MLPAMGLSARTLVLILPHLIARVTAQTPDSGSEIVHASVILLRSGERTPYIQTDQNSTKLTSDGAQRVYQLGLAYRERYINSANSSNPSTSISGLAPHEIDSVQTYLLAQDTQYNDATAQAFMQALYPPYSANPSNSASSPTLGYQYPWIHASSINDPESIYVDGSSSCAAFVSDSAYFKTDEFSETAVESSELYQRVGEKLAHGNMTIDQFNYNNAYTVWDYVSYQYAHNRTVQQAFTAGNLSGDLLPIRYWADEFSWALYGTPDPTHASRIAGQTFGYAVLQRLGTNIQSSGSAGKLSVLFTEYPAFISFASLMGLQTKSSDFRGLPEPGSSMVLELFSKTNGNTSYPDPEDLQVRLLFRNGTNATSGLENYSIGDKNDTTSIPWLKFANKVADFAVGRTADWCSVCNSWSTTAFCLSFNTTAENAAENGFRPAHYSITHTGIMSPGLAGFIGAMTTVGAVLLFIFVMVGCCGINVVRRRGPRLRSPTAIARLGRGGFKGPRKPASDPDIRSTSGSSSNSSDHSRDGSHKSENGYANGDANGHVNGQERMGSWEMKDTGLQRPTSFRRRSFDDEEAFGPGGLGDEIRPSERI